MYSDNSDSKITVQKVVETFEKTELTEENYKIVSVNQTASMLMFLFQSLQFVWKVLFIPLTIHIFLL